MKNPEQLYIAITIKDGDRKAAMFDSVFDFLDHVDNLTPYDYLQIIILRWNRFTKEYERVRTS